MAAESADSADVMRMPTPGSLSRGHALAELALVAHILSVLRLRACRVFNVKPGGRFTNVGLARGLVGKGDELSPVFQTILHGQPSDSDDALNLGAQVQVLFSRLPQEERKEILHLRDLCKWCYVRDTAELVLLCFQLVLKHSGVLLDRQAETSKARYDISERIDKISTGMWIMNKFTGKFNEKSADPYAASAAEKVQKIKTMLQKRR
jgi:hypothetical protein